MAGMVNLDPSKYHVDTYMEKCQHLPPTHLWPLCKQFTNIGDCYFNFKLILLRYPALSDPSSHQITRPSVVRLPTQSLLARQIAFPDLIRHAPYVIEEPAYR